MKTSYFGWRELGNRLIVPRDQNGFAGFCLRNDR
jgi:hypothetical protein